MKKILTLLAVIAAIALPSRAESYTNEQIIAMCDTILNTPYDAKSPSMSHINQLKTNVMEWAVDNHDIKLTIGQWNEELFKDLNQDQGSAMLYAYIMADLRYMLMHGLKETTLESVQAAMRETLEYYKRANGKIRETKSLKRMCRLSEQQFNDFVARQYEATISRQDEELQIRH